MKNQKECYEALSAGETLVNSNGNLAKLNKVGDLVSVEPYEYLLEAFDNSGDWQIYKEPKWYENIPDGGVLCWVKGLGRPTIITTIDKYEPIEECPFSSITKVRYQKVWPLTKQEIQVFMDNAPG